jgi:hypothetical protein
MRERKAIHRPAGWCRSSSFLGGEEREEREKAGKREEVVVGEERECVLMNKAEKGRDVDSAGRINLEPTQCYGYIFNLRHPRHSTAENIPSHRFADLPSKTTNTYVYSYYI